MVGYSIFRNFIQACDGVLCFSRNLLSIIINVSSCTCVRETRMDANVNVCDEKRSENENVCTE